jgi:hypothetical protein
MDHDLAEEMLLFAGQSKVPAAPIAKLTWRPATKTPSLFSIVKVQAEEVVGPVVMGPSSTQVFVLQNCLYFQIGPRPRPSAPD